MSTNVSPILDTYIRYRLTMGNGIVFPCDNYRLVEEGATTGLAFFGEFKRIALMEAANVLLSVDEVQCIHSAVQKGLRLSLIDNNNAVTSLAETMSIDANVPTTLNGKELFAIDNLIDNLRAHLLMTSKQAFVECLEVLNSGLTEQHFEDEEACLACAKRVLIEFRKYKNAA